ncbi:MAG: M1 family metallopeptidase [Flavobacteriales bacterium]|nr:M1 family metallopeptidase [Flavobacteriales bacterium]MCB9190105.1 M1 family metallopeptidase [Flavobacteriales bacterium]MCB9205081.1 M1 family metallopeptidase [Flavobacteriales bacterium]
MRLFPKALDPSHFLIVGLLAVSLSTIAQHGYWQQHVSYQMEIDMDVEKHQFAGKQKLVYTNNSPDTLTRVYYHLYFNAFQPGSMMDIRSRTLPDPDPRVGDRISKLKPEEIGYHTVQSLSQNGKYAEFKVQGTILEVKLPEPILPGAKSEFLMDFYSQVPLQVRRSGRDNAQGIDFSMTQWYPKLAEYDHEGWHPDPYVGREFFGVFGDFDVKISIDKKYVIGGTGYLQNPNEIGHGYQEQGVEVMQPLGDKLTWHFVAPQVHDFAWAADPDFIHDIQYVPNGPTLHFFYQEDTTGNWLKLQQDMVKAWQIMDSKFGKYPYKQFSTIQGGDGGMEYPMATLISSGRAYGGLLSVTVHEAFHNWYYGVLATNESKYPWMDEGFTSYAQDHVLNALNDYKNPNPHLGDVQRMADLYANGLQEPLTTHADHFQTNYCYGVSSYSKGSVFLMQLEYIIGKYDFWKGMKRYFNTWKFKHPTPNDFIRVMEKQSGLELNWFMDLWVGTTQHIDYSIKEVDKEKKGLTSIVLEKIGALPMPLDILVEDKDGNQIWYYIPVGLMRGEKPLEAGQEGRRILPDWEWTNPTYTFDIDLKRKHIKSIEIDPSTRMADLNNINGVYPFPKERKK